MEKFGKLTHFFTDGLDTDLFLRVVAEVVEQDVLPVSPVRDQPEVGQGLLRAADLPLVLRQQVGEVDQEPTVAFALEEAKFILHADGNLSAFSLNLVRWKCEDTGDIIVEEAVLLLAEVANDVAAVRVGGGHHVEEERLDVVVESLVVEEGLGDQAKVLAVLLVLLSTHLGR